MTEDPASAAVTVVCCNSLDELRSAVSERGDDFIYRGQRDSNWKLISPWHREIEWMQEHLNGRRVESLFVPEAYEATIDRYLHHFRNALVRYGAGTAHLKSDDDWWAYGRHADLMTPLLDWTYDLDVAVFFAAMGVVERAIKDDFAEPVRAYPNYAIWALDCTTSPFESEDFEKIETEAGSKSRQEAQRGVFTKLSDGVHFDVESFLKTSGRLNALCRYELPGGSVGDVVKELFDGGIHYASLFPDAWGAAKYANLRRYVSPESLGEILPKQ